MLEDMFLLSAALVKRAQKQKTGNDKSSALTSTLEIGEASLDLNT